MKPAKGDTLSNARPNIDVFIGTKAQYIKTAPLMRLLSEEGMEYRLIDSGQHASFAANLRGELGVKEPDYQMKSDGNIKSVFRAATWFLSNLFLTIFKPGILRRDIFSDGPGYCVIHGDTPTTLLSLLMAKRVGKKVVHLEAGLRSYNLLRPFPEEIVRIICMRFADILFTPSEWAVQNLKQMKVKGEVINLQQNTNVEALYYSLEQAAEVDAPQDEYVLFTVHRVETILNQRRLEFVLDVLERVAEQRRVVFIMHDPTAKKLHDFNLMERLKNVPNIDLHPLVPHDRFLGLLKNASFVLTDGGSIQEESFYLDIPCLLLRKETEREEGLDTNVRLCDFDWEAIDAFLSEYSTLRTGETIKNLEPSRRVLERLKT